MYGEIIIQLSNIGQCTPLSAYLCQAGLPTYVCVSHGVLFGVNRVIYESWSNLLCLLGKNESCFWRSDLF